MSCENVLECVHCTNVGEREREKLRWSRNKNNKLECVTWILTVFFFSFKIRNVFLTLHFNGSVWKKLRYCRKTHIKNWIRWIYVPIKSFSKFCCNFSFWTIKTVMLLQCFEMYCLCCWSSSSLPLLPLPRKHRHSNEYIFHISNSKFCGLFNKNFLIKIANIIVSTIDENFVLNLHVEKMLFNFDSGHSEPGQLRMSNINTNEIKPNRVCLCLEMHLWLNQTFN